MFVNFWQAIIQDFIEPRTFSRESRILGEENQMDLWLR